MKTCVRKINNLKDNDRWTIPFGPTLNLSLFVKQISVSCGSNISSRNEENGTKGQIFYLRIPFVKNKK